MLIADSHAVLIKGRVLTQHQAVLTLVRERVQDPELAILRWLDLACGRGQILSNVEKALSPAKRKKIHYLGFDVSVDYGREAERAACELFGQGQVEICDLRHFERHLAPEAEFDLITMTNTVHEVTPGTLAAILVSALCRVSSSGCCFLYDMEMLQSPELGAIPWRGEEIQGVINAVLAEIGVEAASFPDVAIWPHKSCTCWNLQIHRRHLPVDDIKEHREDLISIATSEIKNALEKKLHETHRQLSMLALYGPETPEDRTDMERLLYDHWAISRALELPAYQPILPGVPEVL